MTAQVWITYGSQGEYETFADFVESVRRAGVFVTTIQGFDPTQDADAMISSEEHGYVELHANVPDDQLPTVLRTLKAAGLVGLTVDYTSEAQADLIDSLGFQCGDDLSEDGPDADDCGEETV